MRPGELQEQQQDDISSDDRAKILAEIDGRLEKSRIKIQPDTFNYTAKRGGVLLPVSINVTAVVVVVLGFLFLNEYFNRKEKQQNRQLGTITTAESKVIGALQEENSAKLNAKNQEIQDIQTRLESANRDRANLKSETEEKLKTRQNELQQEMDALLQAERARLQEEGLAGDDVAARLLEFEESHEKEMAAKVAAERERLQAELTRKDAEIELSINSWEQKLQTEHQDLENLQVERESLQAKLDENLEQQRRAIKERAEALEAVNEIRTLHREERNILGGILDTYTLVNGHIQNARYAQALSELEGLEAYLNLENVSSQPAIQSRLPVERFIIGSLAKLIEIEQTPDDQNALSSGILQRLASVTAKIDEGDRFVRSENMAGAQESYVAAIEIIPEIKTGFSKLNEIYASKAELEGKQWIEQLAAAKGSFLKNEYRQSIDLYKIAVGSLSKNPENAELLVDQIMDAGYWLLSAEDRSTQAKLESTVAELMSSQAELKASVAQLASSLTELETLLGRRTSSLAELTAKQEQRKTKVKRLEDFRDKVRQISKTISTGSGEISIEEKLKLVEIITRVKGIISTESVRSEDPELYEKTVDYFEAFGNERIRDGQIAALENIIGLLDTLAISDDGTTSPTGLLQGLETQAQAALILQILDRILLLSE